MPFHPNIPQPSDDPKVSQSALLDNFSTMNNQFSEDHIPLTFASNQGYHRKLSFQGPAQSIPTATGTEGILYPGSSNSTTQMFFTNAANRYQLTGLEPVRAKITGVTPGGTTVITSNSHLIQAGNTVTLRGIQGITGTINDVPLVVASVTTNTFTVNVVTAGVYTPDTGIVVGSFDNTNNNKFGFFTPWGWTINMGIQTLPVGANVIVFPVPFPTSFLQYACLSSSKNGVFSSWNFDTVTVTVTGGATAFSYFLVGGAA